MYEPTNDTDQSFAQPQSLHAATSLIGALLSRVEYDLVTHAYSSHTTARHHLNHHIQSHHYLPCTNRFQILS